MSGLLTHYLPGLGERATSAHTRVMTFAADVAVSAKVRGTHDAIATLAARKPTTELVRQARRLHAQLTG